MTPSKSARQKPSGSPPVLAKRLAVTFPTVESAVQFWRHHPAFEGSWTPLIEDYARYDLGGLPPRLRSRVTLDSVMADYGTCWTVTRWLAP